MVLIFGSLLDPHVRRVAALIEAFGSPVAVFDPMDGGESRMTLHLTSEPTGVLKWEDQTIELSEVRSVWYRLKPIRDYSHLPLPEFHDHKFVEREWMHVLEPLEELFPEWRWINPRPSSRRLQYKPYQLRLARECGFSIPPTVVGNDPDEILEFAATAGTKLLYKALSSYFQPPDKLLYSRLICADEVRTKRENVEVAPGIYQSYVEKDYELRITVVGEDVFPVRIDSQNCEGAQEDWRREQLSLPCAPASLPPIVHERLLTFHKASGLVYGAYDFIVTPDGEHVFLEVNPSGQWLGFEEKTGIPVSHRLAQELVTDKSKA